MFKGRGSESYSQGEYGEYETGVMSQASEPLISISRGSGHKLEYRLGRPASDDFCGTFRRRVACHDRTLKRGTKKDRLAMSKPEM